MVSFVSSCFNPKERGHGTHRVGGWVGLRTGLDDAEIRRILLLPGPKFQPLSHTACSQSLFHSNLCDVYNLEEWMYIIFLVLLLSLDICFIYLRMLFHSWSCFMNKENVAGTCIVFTFYLKHLWNSDWKFVFQLLLQYCSSIPDVSSDFWPCIISECGRSTQRVRILLGLYLILFSPAMPSVGKLWH
jgi:hypothetical protein